MIPREQGVRGEPGRPFRRSAPSAELARDKCGIRVTSGRPGRYHPYDPAATGYSGRQVVRQTCSQTGPVAYAGNKVADARDL